MRELEFAKKIALRAGEFLRRRRRGPLRIRHKGGGGNMVTEVDRASEEMIVSAIRKEFPDHSVVAEERGAKGASPLRWYIDPLDGTTNFVHRLPFYAVTLAFEAHGRLEAGVTYGPEVGEFFWARRGAGAYRNGERMRVSPTRRLSQALMVTGFPYRRKFRLQNLQYFSAFMPITQAVRRVGVAALDLGWTACGAYDGFWEFKLGPWDMAAGVLLLEEAGARVTDFRGHPVDLMAGEIAAANPRLHRRMLAVIRRTGIY